MTTQQPEALRKTAGFDAADMATASAQGFRDGRASLSLPAAGQEPTSGAHIKKPYSIAEIEAKIASNEYSAELMLQHTMLHVRALSGAAGQEPVANAAHIAAMERAWLWMENQADGQSKGGHETFDLMMLREERDALRAAIDAAPQPAVAAGWVSVGERLPGEQGQDSEEVMVFINGHCALTDFECRQGGAWGIRLGYFDAERQAFRVHGRPEPHVTHWRQEPPAPPLPDAPGPSPADGESNELC